MLFFVDGFSFQTDIPNHEKKTKETFLWYTALLEFSNTNHIEIYITKDLAKNYEKIEPTKYLISIKKFSEFYNLIKKWTNKDFAQAFFTNELDLKNTQFTDTDFQAIVENPKFQEFIKWSATHSKTTAFETEKNISVSIPVVVNTSDFIVCFKTKQEAQQIVDIRDIIQSSNLSLDEIENLSKNLIHKKREEALKIFEELLINNKTNWETFIENYKKKHKLKEKGEETAWHHFLKNNHWIIWLSIDLRFIRDLHSEWNLWIQNTAWKWSPNVDMLWLSDYTTLVELKTANKKIFTEKKKDTSRTNTWSFSDDFIDGISQCLAQKTTWDKTQKTKDLVDKDWNTINQDKIRTIDPECIFLIWNKNKEIPEDSSHSEIHTKRDTLQRFRMNSKNIKIMTFDELYERAKHILDNN